MIVVVTVVVTVVLLGLSGSEGMRFSDGTLDVLEAESNNVTERRFTAPILLDGKSSCFGVEFGIKSGLIATELDICFGCRARNCHIGLRCRTVPNSHGDGLQVTRLLK